MKQQVESLREENQRLEGIVRQQKVSASPVKTPQGGEKSRSQISEAREEITQLRCQVKQLQQEAQTVRGELDAVRQREGDAVECLHQCRAEKQTAEENVELLTAQLAELRQGLQTANDRAVLAEQEAERLATQMSRQQEDAELQRYRALTVQQEKWDARVERLERQLQKYMEREEQFEAQLLEGRRGLQAVPIPEECVSESLEVEARPKQETAGDHSQEETAGTHSQPPPLINYTEAVSPGDKGTSQEDRGEQVKRESSLQFAHTFHGLSPWHLPPLPEFSGDDQTPVNNSFQQWLEQFEMVAELAQWPEHIKLKQLALRFRGPAQAYFQTCSEEQKHDYRALVQAMSKRFTPVRIQALECSAFHERKQGKKESVDTYAQELQRLFQRAYPSAVRGNADAQEMGQAVLSSQFVGGLVPEIKRKIAYLEGVTFSELWQKARFEEVRLRDLESTSVSSYVPKKFYGIANEKHREENPLPRQNHSGNSRLTGQSTRREAVLCFKCHQPGHVAKNCRYGRGLPRTRETEAPGRQAVPKTAAVTSAQETALLANDGPAEPFAWLYGASHDQEEVEDLVQQSKIPCLSLRLGPTPKLLVTVEGIEVEALVDTGCPTTVISKTLCRQILDQGQGRDRQLTLEEHRRQNAQKCVLSKPSLQLHAYCGTQLPIGAEMTLHLQAGECQAKGVVLIQEASPVDLLLGTNLMSQLGVRILDNNGHSLIGLRHSTLPSPTEHNECPTLKDSLSTLSTEVNAPDVSSEHTMSQNQSKHNPRLPTSCQLVSGSRRKRTSGSANSKTSQGEGDNKAVVRLVTACKLPARSGRVLQARARPIRLSSPQIFEPQNRLCNGTVDIANSLLLPSDKGQLSLPVYNFSNTPTWLRRGQILGWIQPADAKEIAQPLSFSHITPSGDDTIESSFELTDKTTPNESEPENEEPEANQLDTNTTELWKTAIKTVMVTANSDNTLLGQDRLDKLKQELHLDKAVLSPEQYSVLETFLLDHGDSFALDSSELGCTQVVQHSINTGDHAPIYQHAHRIPFALRDLAEEMVKDMLDQNIVKPSHSPWASPVVLVKKKDGSMRFCVDYRRLNSVTKRDVHPLPRIDDTLDALAGARYFSTLDLASGYWQVAINPADREKTAFVTHSGLFEFTVMPFGLCNAPATFQRLMETVLEGLARKQCFVYLDDILVISSTWEEHLQNLQLVFERLKQAGLRLKPKKCAFAQQKVTYLGHVISEDGISVDPTKVEKIWTYRTPNNLKSLRQFLGLASYYRRFTPQFSKVAEPLYALTRKNTPFVWSSSCEESFQHLKELLTSPPVLTFPNFKRPFILETDASGLGLGSVLSQEQDDATVRPIAYASRTLQKHERNYGISELEALAVVWATKHFHVYLYGHKCKVLTDHSALKSLLNTPHPSGKLARWGLALQELDLDIVYRPGKQNSAADALSRIPLDTDRNPLVGNVIQDSPLEVQEATVATLQSIPSGSEEESEWPKLQKADGEFVDLITFVKTGDLPTTDSDAKRIILMSANFSLLDDVLYYTQPDGRLQLVVPKDQRQKLIEEAHGGAMAGHLREMKIYSQLQKHYWWPNMRADIRKWCQSCLVCASRHVGQAQKPPLSPIPVAGPFDCIGVDIIQFPCSYDGNKYAVVFMDYLTKWPEVFAIADQKAETVARALVEVVSRHGVPAKLLSDRGANFLSDLLHEVYVLLGIRKINTSAYHPQTDGLVERFNRTLTDMLAKTVDHCGRDWDRRIPYVLYAYRTCVQESTQESPFYLLYGRDARLPTEAALAKPRTCYQMDIDDFKTNLVCNLSDAWTLAHQNISKAQKKQKQQYDRKAKMRKYRVGDRVFVHMPGDVSGKAWKFARPFHGPYRILELTPTNASVRLVNRPQDTPIFVSLQRIRTCPKEIPDEKSWSGQKQQRKRVKAAGRQDQRPTQIPKEITGDCPAIDTSTAHNKLEPWSKRLRPRRGRTLISRGEM